MTFVFGSVINNSQDRSRRNDITRGNIGFGKNGKRGGSGTPPTVVASDSDVVAS
jgi:hypothetical protein